MGLLSAEIARRADALRAAEDRERVARQAERDRLARHPLVPPIDLKAAGEAAEPEVFEASLDRELREKMSR